MRAVASVLSVLLLFAGCSSDAGQSPAPVGDAPIEEFVMADPGSGQLVPAGIGTELPRRTLASNTTGTRCDTGAGVLYGGTQYCAGRSR